MGFRPMSRDSEAHRYRNGGLEARATSRMPTILGIESTCDETAAAVVVDGYDVRSNVVASQAELHAKYRGVVPEIASRAHIENLLPVLGEAMEGDKGTGGGGDKGTRGHGDQGRDRPDETAASSVSLSPCPLVPLSLSNVDAVAVAHRPGLIGSLLVGVTAAKTLAWATGKPLIGVDHVHAHLYSVVLETNEQPPMPAAGLVVSGGHTALYRVGSWLDVELLGSTIDDAVGEAYDKVAALLGLGYPGGPILDKLAERGDPRAVRFPRTMLGEDSLDFSFSGLKTAVLYHVHGVPSRHQKIDTSRPPELPEQRLADIAASFQAACTDVIATKLKRAVAHLGARSVIIGGGVSANRGLRAALARFPVPVYFPPMRYCTDNAAMSAGLAHVYYVEGRFSALDLDAVTHSQFRDP
jgi:N6-L-threonylcarbamoyladenine synthase